MIPHITEESIASLKKAMKKKIDYEAFFNLTSEEKAGLNVFKENEILDIN